MSEHHPNGDGCTHPEAIQARLIEAESERDMYREKAHRFIASAARWDAQYRLLWNEHHSLIDAIEALAKKADQRAVMAIAEAELRRFTEPHYRDDGPNGETTTCNCGIGIDHTREDLLALYDEDGGS